MRTYFSLVIVFFVCKNYYSQTISIVYPKNNSIHCGVNTFFEWNSMNNSDNEIHFQCANDSLFQNIIIDTITTNNHIEIESNRNLKY